MIFIILFLNLFLSGSWGQSQPQIIHISGNQVVNVGDTIDLECSVDNANGFPVIWKKVGSNVGDGLIITSGSAIVLRDQRVSLQVVDSESTYKLTIKEANENDAGTYQCEIVAAITETFAESVKVDVKDLEVKDLEPTISKITESQFIMEGGSVELQCTVENAKDRHVAWRKLRPEFDSTNLLSVDDILVSRSNRYSVKVSEDGDLITYSFGIKDTQLADAGNYSCIVEDSNFISKDVELKYISSKPEIKHLEGSQVINLGGTENLTCSTQYSKDFPVSWKKLNSNGTDAETITIGDHVSAQDDRFSIEVIKNEDEESYILTIKDTQENDAGTYQCQIVISPTETISKNIVVEVVNNNPKIVDISEDILSLEGETIELRCITENLENNPVVWRRLQSNYDQSGRLFSVLTAGEIRVSSDNRFSITVEDDSSTYILRIKNATLSDSTTYRCEINPYPLSSKDVEVKVVQSKPKITEITNDQFVNLGSTLNIQCSTEYAEEFPVYWKKVEPSSNTETILSKGNKIISHDDRLSLEVNEDNTTYKLQIKDMEEKDSGVYQCQIVASPKVIFSKNVEIIVKDQNPKISSITESQKIPEGDPVELECFTENAKNYPAIWIKMEPNSSTILTAAQSVLIPDDRLSLEVKEDHSTNYKLSIKDTQESDSATYQCRLIAPTHNVISKDVQVEILPKPDSNPKIDKISEDQVVNEGETAHLECSTKQDRPLIWKKKIRDGSNVIISINGNLILLDFRYAITVDEEKGINKLSIKNTNVNDSGKYQCEILLDSMEILIKGVTLKVNQKNTSKSSKG